MDAPKDCPACGLVNPWEAVRCDCGYDFPTRRMAGSYLGEKDHARAANYREVGSHQAAVAAGLIPGVPGSDLGGTLILIPAAVVGFAGGHALGISDTNLLTALFGVAAVLFGVAFRKIVVRCGLFDFRRGGRLLFIPVWILGFIWIGLGLIRWALNQE